MKTIEAKNISRKQMRQMIFAAYKACFEGTLSVERLAVMTKAHINVVKDFEDITARRQLKQEKNV